MLRGVASEAAFFVGDGLLAPPRAGDFDLRDAVPLLSDAEAFPGSKVMEPKALGPKGRANEPPALLHPGGAITPLTSTRLLLLAEHLTGVGVVPMTRSIGIEPPTDVRRDSPALATAHPRASQAGGEGCGTPAGIAPPGEARAPGGRMWRHTTGKFASAGGLPGSKVGAPGPAAHAAAGAVTEVAVACGGICTDAAATTCMEPPSIGGYFPDQPLPTTIV